MSFDLEKMQAYAELGEVIRLQNEAMDKLAAFRKARPAMIMPNLAKMVEENMKENVQVLYKELNNLHKPAEQQTRYICNDCKMAFLVPLPGGICDECRANRTSKPREYVLYQGEGDEADTDATATDEDTTAANADTTTTDANAIGDVTDSANANPAEEPGAESAGETPAETPAESAAETAPASAAADDTSAADDAPETPADNEDVKNDKPSDEFEKFFSMNPSEDGEK